VPTGGVVLVAGVLSLGCVRSCGFPLFSTLKGAGGQSAPSESLCLPELAPA
jgi:hypothetical protein